MNGEPVNDADRDPRPDARALTDGVIDAPKLLLHPLAVVALPIPAIVAVLVAEGASVGVLAVLIGLVVIALKRPKLALASLAMSIAMSVVLWWGFAFSLPRDPAGADEIVAWLPLQPPIDVALMAVRGAMRIVAVMVLFVATVVWARWQILGDTLIRFGRVPYRIVDVVALGGRFGVLIQQDVRAARRIAVLRTRGRWWRSIGLLTGLMIPVLMASFRHADELTIAMEARGFGARPDRTVHDAVPVRVRDGVVVLVVWTVSIVAAVALDRLAF